MWNDFKSFIWSVIFFSFISGGLVYYFLFSGYSNVEELFYQDAYQSNYEIKNKEIKVSYEDWLRKKIEDGEIK